MRTIWKYILRPSREPERVVMPEGAVILHAHEQHDEICVWAEVVTTRRTADRFFEVFGTGWEMQPADRRYVGTAHIGGGSPLVFHVYERLSP